MSILLDIIRTAPTIFQYSNKQEPLTKEMMSTLLLILLLALVVEAAMAVDTPGGGSERSRSSKSREFMTLAATLLAGFPAGDFGVEEDDDSDDDPRLGTKARVRKRQYVTKIFNEHGPIYTRRAYRMDASAFWKLEALLRPRMIKRKSRVVSLKHDGSYKRRNDGARNGRISTAIRLSAALRYFSGGRPDDISISHGISHSEVFNSVWIVVDAVNTTKELSFHFPSDHEQQRRIAKGFKARSRCGFDCCVGAMDGMLLWTEKPTLTSCSYAKCEPKRFFCGRKHRFGLNFQAICDHKGRFLDIHCGSPAATSDFLSFTLSEIYRKLEQEAFLAPGLCIFGDSAYVNNRYLATPYR